MKHSTKGFQLVAHAHGARDAGLEDDGGTAVGGDRPDDLEGHGWQRRHAGED